MTDYKFSTQIKRLSIALIIISVNMGLDNVIILGDLCLIISCWTIASEVAFIKNKTV